MLDVHAARTVGSSHGVPPLVVPDVVLPPTTTPAPSDEDGAWLGDGTSVPPSRGSVNRCRTARRPASGGARVRPCLVVGATVYTPAVGDRPWGDPAARLPSRGALPPSPRAVRTAPATRTTSEDR
ncbi:hypothetical protein GCM10025868_35250 [Angustibacter aerolatus]|uniref:Uncharacterized protein n=1 Tax=Angustibacter aerolatus TaxID=1162965 RepID=A0ABQ6JJ59_9ACTN|nr:hypothetical protein GCM10025868_35250 [Angustibacter aerolatus]